MVITPNEYIRDWHHLKEIFTTDIHHFGLDNSDFYRPLQAVSYALDYTFWKLNPMGYHISSVLYHILNAFLIYMLLLPVLNYLDSKLRERSRWIALGTSLIWLVHPIHSQVVTYAAGRADELAAFFILLTLITFMRGQKIGSWLCFVGALLSKEFGVITPVFVLLFDYFGLTVNKDGRWKKLTPFLIIFAVYAVLRLTVLKFPQDVSEAFIPGIYGRLLTSAEAIMILFGLLAVPVGLSMDRNIAWANTFFKWQVVASVLLVLVLAVLAWKWRKKEPVISFGLLFFFTGYALVMDIIKMNANVSEHWMYIPSIGIWLVFCYLLAGKLPWMRKRLFFPLIAAMVVYFGAFLVGRNADFKDEITFYKQILKRHYDDARVHYNLGCAYFFAGDMDKSYFHLSEAIRFNPDYAAAYGNLGQLEYRRGHLKKAIALYEKANALKPDLVENRANLGTAYSDAGRFADAMEQLNIALKLNPKHTGALNNMGIVYGRQGKFDLAEKYFRRVLAMDPGNTAAQNNLKRINELRHKYPPK